MKIGFIGLGNVGGKLAGSLIRNGHDVVIRDLDKDIARPLLDAGATWGDSPRAMIEACAAVITCLPSPAASAAVMEAEDGILAGMTPGKIWMEMSTTDEAEVKRLGALVHAKGGAAVDCPVSGGCHRADTGNISIFAGCERETFEHLMPVFKSLGRRILHTGPLGSASILKVITNYLATANRPTSSGGWRMRPACRFSPMASRPKSPMTSRKRKDTRSCAEDGRKCGTRNCHNKEYAGFTLTKPD